MAVAGLTRADRPASVPESAESRGALSVEAEPKRLSDGLERSQWLVLLAIVVGVGFLAVGFRSEIRGWIEGRTRRSATKPMRRPWDVPTRDCRLPGPPCSPPGRPV